jgi:hypothetical protein
MLSDEKRESKKSRGDNSMVYKSKIYTHDKGLDNKVSWRCFKRVCAGRIHVYKGNEVIVVVKEHTCETSDADILKFKIMRRIEEDSKNTLYTLAQIYSN